MSQYVEGPTKTFAAGAALAVHTRVKIDSGVLAAAGAGADDDTLEIGTLVQASFASGDVVAVRLRNAPGTCKMVAAGDFAAGVAVYGAAAGTIDEDVSGNPIGIAMEASGAAGDVVEVLRY